jgi:ribonuclease I
MEQCRAFAYAEIALWRVRAARVAILDQAAAQLGEKDLPNNEREGAALLAAMPQLVRLERYERRAHSRCKRAARKLDPIT